MGLASIRACRLVGSRGVTLILSDSPGDGVSAAKESDTFNIGISTPATLCRFSCSTASAFSKIRTRFTRFSALRFFSDESSANSASSARSVATVARELASSTFASSSATRSRFSCSSSSTCSRSDATVVSLFSRSLTARFTSSCRAWACSTAARPLTEAAPAPVPEEDAGRRWLPPAFAFEAKDCQRLPLFGTLDLSACSEAESTSASSDRVARSTISKSSETA
mmetsp:Transcript_10439/g.26130  ORF Transcript_10439/g.26130 Transcript_10439/m.26130 type:complete len:224 (+) Transcript_10439:1094-1765(+)